jgi:uncharacterized membrane protein (DUF4010 family)
VFVAAAFALRLFDGGAGQTGQRDMSSPLKVASVAKFALLLGAFIIIGRIVSEHYGEGVLLPFAATAGIADVDAVTLAAGTLVRGGLDPAIGAHAILVGAVMNTISKGVIGLIAGGWRYAAFYFGAALAAGAAAAAAWFLVTPFILPMFQ